VARCIDCSMNDEQLCMLLQIWMLWNYGQQYNNNTNDSYWKTWIYWFYIHVTTYFAYSSKKYIYNRVLFGNLLFLCFCLVGKRAFKFWNSILSSAYNENENIGLGDMMFNATFNNITVLSWPSVLLEEETGKNHQPAVSHCQALSDNVYNSQC
jgi:hypothetical protein